jgi:hypothetical protein
MAKRGYGTGHLYEKSGCYYGRWRTLDGRYLNRKVGARRVPGETDGLTRAQAERQFRKMQEAEELTPRPPVGRVRTVEEMGRSLRERLELRGLRKSYRENCEYMQRVHIGPVLGDRTATPARSRPSVTRRLHSTKSPNRLDARLSGRCQIGASLAGPIRRSSQSRRAHRSLTCSHPRHVERASSSLQAFFVVPGPAAVG